MVSYRKARTARGLVMRKPRFRVPNARELNTRFAGKHVAIIDGVVVASGKSPMEVWKRAKKIHPQAKPVLAFVSDRDVLVMSEDARKPKRSYYGLARAIGPFRVEDEMTGHD